MMKTLSIFFALFILTLELHANSIEGEWLKSDGSARIILSVTKSGELQGKISWIKDSSRTHDSNNPDPKLQKRKLIGLTFLTGFKKESKKDLWSGGTVYDSQSGKTYKGRIWLEGPDNLKMRGFVGVSLIGRTAKWKRYK